MLYLAPLFLLVISYIFGEITVALFRDDNIVAAEKCLIGTFVLLISFEMFYIPAVYFSIPFHITCRMFSLFLLAVIVLALLFNGKRMAKNIRINNPVDLKPCIHVLLILAIQIICFFVLMPDKTMDQTIETVNMTLASDSFYGNHPGTGEAYTGGMTVRGVFVSLPYFFSYVYSLFEGNTACFVYRAMPMWSLFLSFICYGLWARLLFENEERIDGKISIFLTGLGLLNLSGMFSKDCIFYSQMFRGFRGETICFVMILPYCIYVLLEMICKKNNKKVIYIIMALLAELTIADHEKCFIPTIACILLGIIMCQCVRFWRWIKCRQL